MPINLDPIIVTGTGRSGSTWLQWFLCSHPDLVIAGQPQGVIIEDIYPFYSKLASSSKWVQKANKILKYKVPHYAGSNPDRSVILLKTFLRDYWLGNQLDVFDRKYWGLKWLHVCHDRPAAEKINEIWPDSKWIVCIRDPFTGFESVKRTFMPEYKFDKWIHNWLLSAKYPTEQPNATGFQLDLVSKMGEDDRVIETGKILNFLGVEHTDQTIRFVRGWPRIHTRQQTGTKNNFSLSMEDREKVMPLLSEEMERLGYLSRE